MNEQEKLKDLEKQRVTHLLILTVYTISTVILLAESLLMNWDPGVIVLLLFSLILCWVLHITNKLTMDIRLWLYMGLSMLEFFFYGIHETSVYDLAPVMIVAMVLFSVSEKYSIIRFCMITYFLTMIYDLFFILDPIKEFSILILSRTLLHFFLVVITGKLLHVDIDRRNEERKENKIKVEKLEELNQRTEDFLTNVSHELRTPINAVTGITTVMLKNEMDNKKREDLLAIQTAGQRLFKQIDDILDYTELDTSRLTVCTENYNITSVINDIISENRISNRNSSLETIYDIDAGIPSMLLGDSRKVKKIISHLLSNAYKFTKRGGIYVRVYQLKKNYGINLCIEVCDTGIGMTPEEVKKIRKQFYQSSAGRTRHAGGLGLGLSIVHGLVTAMNGFLRIESTLGEGTSVFVSIPQRVSEAQACMAVENRKSLCLACFLKPEKYEVPRLRDFYRQMITNLVKELEVTFHSVGNLDELKRLLTLYDFTHLFLGKEEYLESVDYFNKLSDKIRIVVVADEQFKLQTSNNIRLMKKPFYSLPVVNLLNSGEAEDTLYKDMQMICSGIRVLVVDDEPMNLMVAKGVFLEYQMEVTTVDNGMDAISLCKNNTYDIIFLDHMMPEMDGVETLKRIRKAQTEQGEKSEIVAFTANAISGAREMFLNEGFDEFISKPIEVVALEHVLKKLLPKSSITYVQRNLTDQASNPDSNNFEQDDSNSRLEDLGLDTAQGITYCNNDKEFYEEMLHKFCNDAKRKSVQIETAFLEEDWENYTIFVHALKSTSKMIGAFILSDHAKAAEAASKERDVEYVKQNHSSLLHEYHELVEGISAILLPDKKEDAADTVSVIAHEEFLSVLTELKSVLDTFEAEKAEEILDSLTEKTYEKHALSDLLTEVRQEVDNFDLMNAAGLVEMLLHKLEGGEL